MEDNSGRALVHSVPDVLRRHTSSTASALTPRSTAYTLVGWPIVEDVNVPEGWAVIVTPDNVRVIKLPEIL